MFAIPLADKTFSFGQVLDKRYCTCVLFNYKSDNPKLSNLYFLELRPLSILHLSNGDLLNNGQWTIIFNEQVKLNPSVGYGGLEPWKVMFEENYYDKLLLKDITIPDTAIILSQAERNKYRREKFGIK